MAKRVTEKDIIEMNEAYLICKSYSGVAAATGWSVSTVRKYIIDKYVPQDKQVQMKIFFLKTPEEAAEYLTNHSNLSAVTPEEKVSLKKIQKGFVI